jgi:hypothetical protein
MLTHQHSREAAPPLKIKDLATKKPAAKSFYYKE